MEVVVLTQSNYQSELNPENTIYEIYETIVFSGTFTIPHNSILRFCGGKLVGTTAPESDSIDLTNCGTICSDRCIIEAPLVKVFDRVKFSGDFLFGQVFQIEWFVDNYESAFNPNSDKDASIEINRALISGIHKIHFNNDRYYHIKQTITLTGNLDISGEKTHVDADTTNGQLWWNGSKWIERDGASAGVRRSGTFAQKPTGSSIYVGFRYFCTSGATVQGTSLSNIELFYTGSSWVDALGRTAS